MHVRVTFDSYTWLKTSLDVHARCQTLMPRDRSQSNKLGNQANGKGVLHVGVSVVIRLKDDWLVKCIDDVFPDRAVDAILQLV